MTKHWPDHQQAQIGFYNKALGVDLNSQNYRSDKICIFPKTGFLHHSHRDQFCKYIFLAMFLSDHSEFNEVHSSVYLSMHL